MNEIERAVARIERWLSFHLVGTSGRVTLDYANIDGCQGGFSWLHINLLEAERGNRRILVRNVESLQCDQIWISNET